MKIKRISDNEGVYRRFKLTPIGSVGINGCVVRDGSVFRDICKYYFMKYITLKGEHHLPLLEDRRSLREGGLSTLVVKVEDKEYHND